MSTRRESSHGELLRLLKEKEGKFCPGPELASRLELTRTGVWKHIRKLRSLGYKIESHPKEGYRLVEVPDLLIPEEIAPHLETSWLGRPYYHFPEIGSTNDEVLRLASQGVSPGCVVLAEQQTAGRGRLKRPWFSPPGCGIYLSMLLKAPLALRDAPQSVLIAALSLARVLSDIYGLSASIKWPNDVLIRGKKVAGILAEMQSDQEMIRFLVIGIGINVNQAPDQLQGPFRYPATSVAAELGRSVKRRELLLAFLHGFEREYERFLQKGLAVFLPDLEKASGILGKDIKIVRGREETSGKAAGFTPEGGLRVLRDDGLEEIFWVGDITRVEGIS